MTNEQVVHQFYQAFQRLDYAAMQSAYADDAVFQDPAFGSLNADEVRAMWEMLCKRAKDFSLVYSDVVAHDAEYVSCRWQASYLFSATGRHVVNDIKAYLRVRDGKIIEHTDEFSFWRWSRQALGFSGLLLGWSPFLRRKVQTTARQGLKKFMEKPASTH